MHSFIFNFLNGSQTRNDKIRICYTDNIGVINIYENILRILNCRFKVFLLRAYMTTYLRGIDDDDDDDDWSFTVMKRNERWNTLQICPRRDSKTGGSGLWSNTLALNHGGALLGIERLCMFVQLYMIHEDMRRHALPCCHGCPKPVSTKTFNQ